MSLEDKIKEDLKEAMKKGDNVTRDVLRSLTSDIKNEFIKTQKALEEKDVIDVVRRNIKRHKDSIEQFVSGAREDLAAKEREELAILEKYQPEQMSEVEIENVVRQTVEKMGENAKNFGLVMKEAMKEIDGRADGTVVSGIVKKVLNG